jgi:hypothetical protein
MAATLGAKDLVLVEKRLSKAPIILPTNASPATVEAAGELARYIEKIAGVRPEVLLGVSNSAPAPAVWVGMQPPLAALFPATDFSLPHPEETLIVCDGLNLAIVGRDRMSGTNQLEYGTANAVYTFLEKNLGVRWLWPGDLGEDVPRQDTIALAPFEHRFHPPFRHRWLWPRRDRDWNLKQRLLLASYPVSNGHAYEDWWEQYHEAHPDFFALQPDGTRDFSKHPKDAKLCVSNPRVAQQWLEKAVGHFAADPLRVMASATPNDGPWFCVCDSCRAWDPTNAPATVMYGLGGSYTAPALSDRYVKYWNSLARGLRERLPDREAYVGALAYSAYKTPPVKEALERNIVVGYVGHFPLAGDETTKSEKAAWLGWADKASVMVFRPNLFHYSGGWLGLPTLALRRTMRDFRFLADNKCVGIEVDTLPLTWATQGVQYYLLAQMTYDPRQDGEAVLKDYCQRGFGPAAAPVAAYFDLMEQAHEAILARIKHSSGAARELIGICQEVYTDAIMDRATALMREAGEKAATGDDIHRRRTAFLRTGHEFVTLQVGIIRAMKRARESQGKDGEAVRIASELCAKREAILKEHEGIAFRRADWYHKGRQLDDYMGPPSATLRQAAGGDAALPGFEARD